MKLAKIASFGSLNFKLLKTEEILRPNLFLKNLSDSSTLLFVIYKPKISYACT